MSKQSSKLAVIGLDCCLPNMIQKYIDEDELPNIGALVKNGFFAEDCLCPLPTITPPNWATIATGAWPGTHGITCFHHHLEGTNPDNRNIRQSWDSRRWQAEPIWEAADKQGKKSIVLAYPGSWPGNLKHGIIVGGMGFIPGDRREGLAGLDSEFTMAQDFVVSTQVSPYGPRVHINDASGWKNLPPNAQSEPLEVSFPLPSKGGSEDLSHIVWHLLLFKDGGDDYNTVAFCPEKDFSKAFCILKKNDWSSKIIYTLKGKEKDTEVFFRCKLINVADDGEEVLFLCGAMVATDGSWCSKPEYAKYMTKGDACLHRSGGMFLYTAGHVIDRKTFVEMADSITSWLAQAATALMEAIPDWSLFYMHSHPCDWYYHAAITDMASPDPAISVSAWEDHKSVYKNEDKLVGAIVKAAGPDTLFCVVSDHGATIDGPSFNPYDALIPAGISVMKDKQEILDADETHRNQVLRRLLGHVLDEVNYSKTKAVPQRETYVYINLKGRDPEGIVDPKDYASVQQEIIDALITYRDPNMNNRRPVALALTKEDARILGLYGDRIGDVVYAINPEWGAQHGAILPTAKYSIGVLQSLFILSGPGVKKGYSMKKPCRLVDLVPTVCFVTGLPYPADAEGAVLYPILEDPNGTCR